MKLLGIFILLTVFSIVTMLYAQSSSEYYYNNDVRLQGDAIFKMRDKDNSDVVRNVVIPIHAASVMGWDADSVPCAIPISSFTPSPGTPNIMTFGREGKTLYDSNYLYIYHNNSWRKATLTNL